MGDENIAAATPPKAHYKKRAHTCFTPWVVSLVDAFGDVYVCCHHYDDHGKLRGSERQEYRL